MYVIATPMRERGQQRPKRDIEHAQGVSGDMLITHEHSEAYGRATKIASFLMAGASDEPPLPPLHDVELSWMGSNGFLLTGIEFIGQTVYAQSWWCRAPVAKHDE
ncbi:hypothetical protein [Paraburkholderia sp. MM5477-R1]|uniref:hypothetical protein n=1 Tax=Paraburkholderia sp. MM5477-R1 TaxID=2991062 RepID=UPI003D205A24